MNKIYSFIIILIAFITLSGCVDKVGSPTYFYKSQSYVVQYVQYDDIELDLFYNDLLDCFYFDNHQAIMVLCVKDGKGCDAVSEEKNNKAMYQSKCMEINDFGYEYNGSSTFDKAYDHTHWYNDVTTINITSDKDYDTEHPSGASLNDVFYLLSMSPYKFIESGYKKKFDFHETDLSVFPDYLLEFKDILQFGTPYGKPTNDKTLHPVYGLVSELKAEDMKLMGGYRECGRSKGGKLCYFILCPASEPADNKIHDITVEIKDMYGNIFSDSIQITFE